MVGLRGTVHEEFDGKTYALRLTIGGIAKLQEKHGQTVGGILDGTAGDMPPFRAVLDLVSVALQKGEGMTEDQATDIADDLVTNDMEIVGRVVLAAFPDQKGDGARGKGKKPKAA